jgi:hypothetical protein
MIDHELPGEIARISRWTFARALLFEALRTGKRRDLIDTIPLELIPALIGRQTADLLTRRLG